MKEKLRRFAQAIADGKTANLKWITNIPKDQAHHFMEHCTWYDAFEGIPEPTSKYSIEELEKMGRVGIYTDITKPQKPAKPVDTCTYCRDRSGQGNHGSMQGFSGDPGLIRWAQDNNKEWHKSYGGKYGHGFIACTGEKVSDTALTCNGNPYRHADKTKMCLKCIQGIKD